jgi:hypothetical protein
VLTVQTDVIDEAQPRAIKQWLPRLATRMTWSLDPQLEYVLQVAPEHPPIMTKLADALRVELERPAAGDVLDAG